MNKKFSYGDHFDKFNLLFVSVTLIGGVVFLIFAASAFLIDPEA